MSRSPPVVHLYDLDLVRERRRVELQGSARVKKAPLVLPATTPQDVADRVAPPPDVNGSSDERTLRAGNVTRPAAALGGAELSRRWIGEPCRRNVRTAPEVDGRGSSRSCHLCFPATSRRWAAWKPNSVPRGLCRQSTPFR